MPDEKVEVNQVENLIRLRLKVEELEKAVELINKKLDLHFKEHRDIEEEDL